MEYTNLKGRIIYMKSSTHYKYWVKIGLNVAYYRKEQNLTTQDLAEMASISRNHLQRIESGYAASVDVFMCIAEALGVPLSRLFDFRE